MLQVIPAIDLMGGRVVRLNRGRAEACEFYPFDPVDLARRYQAAGATRLHIVDLDGAFEGAPRNLGVIEAMLALGLAVQVGGGLRDVTQVKQVIDAGATAAVIGTRALTDPAFVEEVVALLGDRLIVGVDALDGQVRTKGWTEGSGESYLEAGARLGRAGVRYLLYTCISRDGTLEGPDVDGTAALARTSGTQVIASGGVSCLDDLTRLARRTGDGIHGVVIGKALLDGRFSVEDALARGREVG